MQLENPSLSYMNLGTNENESATASADATGIQSVKGKSYAESTYEDRNVVHLIHGMKDIEIKPIQDGEMVLTGKHSIDQPCVTDAGRISSNSWPQVIDSEETVGVGDSKPQHSHRKWGSWEPACKVPSPTISPQQQNGCQWSEKADKPGLQTNILFKNSNVYPQDRLNAVYDPESDKLPQCGDASFYDDELLDDSEDDLSDGFDSDDCQKSHDMRKKSKFLRPFFESLDNLSLKQIGEEARRWHCPACQDGPGAINWFTGMQSLLTHSKTKGRIRMRLHRELAELLDEELRRRGISFIPSGEALGKWKGLCETTPDHEIVWPPMVIVMNTILEKDENDKWKGMGNQELLEYFNNYEAVKARHSYGPNGHRGMSVLIFEASSMGYLEAERLHKQFLSEGRDRNSWEWPPVSFYPEGRRQLYGFLASKEDVIIFNRHSHGKACLKYDMRSYQEMVAGPLKKMNEDSQILILYKNKFIKLEQCIKAIEKTLGIARQNLLDIFEEIQIVRLRTKFQQEENKEEMDYQERTFNVQMDKIHNATEEFKREFEKLLQAKQSDVSSKTIINSNQRKEDIQSFIVGQMKSVEEFEAEREELIRLHEENKIKLKRKHLTEYIEFERNFGAHLIKLTDKYAKPTFQVSSSSS